MSGDVLRTYGAIVLILVVAAGLAWAGSGQSVEAFGVPLFALCGAVAFVINWIVFVPSYLRQTEIYFDLTGSLTYLSVVGLALAFGPREPRSVLLAALVAIWAVRLGSFLFRRVRAAGADERFDSLKAFPDFLMTWTLQGLWVFLTVACALAALTSTNAAPFGVVGAIGLAIWLAGFAIEVVADRQKSAFRADEANRGRFITSGLWAWSRHPNYFGEIVLWLGVAVIAFPVLQGGQLATLISPVFVTLLLTRISGVPLLERRAKKAWGDDPEYQAYKARTPVLIPRPPRAA